MEKKKKSINIEKILKKNRLILFTCLPQYQSNAVVANICDIVENLCINIAPNCINNITPKNTIKTRPIGSNSKYSREIVISVVLSSYTIKFLAPNGQRT